jgi:hypothetical protein
VCGHAAPASTESIDDEKLIMFPDRTSSAARDPARCHAASGVLVFILADRPNR